MNIITSTIPCTILLIMINYSSNELSAQGTSNENELVKKVKNFLNSRENKWHDLNVPASDQLPFINMNLRFTMSQWKESILTIGLSNPIWK